MWMILSTSLPFFNSNNFFLHSPLVTHSHGHIPGLIITISYTTSKILIWNLTLSAFYLLSFQFLHGYYGPLVGTVPQFLCSYLHLLDLPGKTLELAKLHSSTPCLCLNWSVWNKMYNSWLVAFLIYDPKSQGTLSSPLCNRTLYTFSLLIANTPSSLHSPITALPLIYWEGISNTKRTQSSHHPIYQPIYICIQLISSIYSTNIFEHSLYVDVILGMRTQWWTKQINFLGILCPKKLMF